MTLASCFFLTTALHILGQVGEGAPKAGLDVLILSDGEKLIGQLESATSTSVVFKSKMAGELTLAWKDVQEVRSSHEFAAIPKGAKLRGSDDASVSHGVVSATNQQLNLQGTRGSAQSVATNSIGNLVEEAAFDKAFQRISLLQGWKGSATAGLALTESTQNNESFTSAINLVRSVPAESWLDARSRSTFDYNQAYGKLTQPGTPAIKSSLYHIGVEEDWYLSPRVFAFGEALFDHSFSQGLSLQQNYGGGLGFVALKSTKQELDFKASANYIDQRFELSSLNKKLFGSVFGETYVRTFTHGILFNEQAGIAPAWTDTNAYSAFASAALTFPVYHHFGVTLGALDDFLNNPPPGFKKNSFQFTAGATYFLK